jgi:glycerophosphoryl diester phosphodiesterase
MMIALIGLAAIMKPSTQAILAKSWTETRVIGHRGAAAYRPENTLPAFEEAIRCKADATECDVHTSKDGELVVMHDSTLDRTTRLRGAIKETAWAEMNKAGIPSLADLTRVTKDRIVLVVEIKEGVDIERKVVDHLNAQEMKDQSIIFSFGEDHIEKVEKLDPDYVSVWLVGKEMQIDEYKGVLDRAKSIGADGIGLPYKNVTPEIVKMARDRKVPVFVWTVPPGPEVDRLRSLKVNFIITNHPRDVRAQLQK